MAAFKKTNVMIFQKPSPNITPDTLYWKKYGVPSLVKEFGAIDYISFSPVEPHYFAITCSARVQIYNPVTKIVQKNLNKFREAAYGGNFRSDGQLICVGGDECAVKLFDVTTKSLLRVFKGHTGSVHRCFFTLDKTHITSFSDDKSVKLWDIPTESEINSFAEHTDYIRAGAVSPISSDIILSGSYDNTVRMYDTRIEKSVFTVDHGAPVESVTFLSTGGVFISAGGTEIRVWDALAGGRLIAKLCHHHKTITCLCLGSGNKRLLSGSLDRHVKIYDVATYQFVHTLDFPNAILSLDVSPGDETFVAGMVDGLVSISQREETEMVTRKERRKVSYHYAPNEFHSITVDDIVKLETKEPLSTFDNYLRRFQYGSALIQAMSSSFSQKKPFVTVGLFQELIRRDGLRRGLVGRSDKFLISIVTFLLTHIGDYRFARTLIEVANVFLDVYEGYTFSGGLQTLICGLANRVKKEENLIEDLIALQGALQLLLSGASIRDNSDTHSVTNAAMIEPSANAESNFVVNIA